MEDRAATPSLSAALWYQIWFDAFGGYDYDRYAKTAAACAVPASG